MKISVFIFIIWSLKSTLKGNGFPNYKIYNVRSKNGFENMAAKIFYLDGVELLKRKNNLKGNITFAVSSEAETDFANFLTELNIEYEKKADDIFRQFRKKLRDAAFGVNQNVSNDGKFNFGNFFTYEEISSYMNYLSENHKDIAQVRVIGKTYEQRNIYGVVISQKKSSKKTTGVKPIIFFDAGIHAREWFASILGLYMLNQFIENATVRDIYLPYVDFAIVPLANPDGYTYSRTVKPFWRKNRFPHKTCIGTDLNRNFDVHWRYTESQSDLMCESSVFPGPKAFSESETQAIRNFAMSFPKKSIQLYVGLHTYGQYLLYSYGFSKEPPPDIDDLVRCSNFINRYLDNQYTVGSAGVLLPPPVGGGSDDYFKTVLDVKYSFTMELTNKYDFSPPETALKEEAHFAMRGIYGFADFIKKENADKNH